MGYTFVSGHLALDLTGTVGHRGAPDQYELLTEPATLASWIRDAGLLDDPPPINQDDLSRTRSLRESIYRMAKARLDGMPGSTQDHALLNSAAEPTPIAVRLSENGAVTRSGELTAIHSTIARVAIELLGGADGANLKACEATPCSRLYLDGSRRRSRRWCDMRMCGNRAKASAYRQRTAGAGSP